MKTRQEGKCKMKRTLYEVWAKCWSAKEGDIIMKLRGTFEYITDAEIFSAAYENRYSTKTVTIKVDKN